MAGPTWPRDRRSGLGVPCACRKPASCREARTESSPAGHEQTRATPSSHRLRTEAQQREAPRPRQSRGVRRRGTQHRTDGDGVSDGTQAAARVADPETEQVGGAMGERAEMWPDGSHLCAHTPSRTRVYSTCSLNDERMFSFTHSEKNADYNGIWQTPAALLLRAQGGRAKLENGVAPSS